MLIMVGNEAPKSLKKGLAPVENYSASIFGDLVF